MERFMHTPQACASEGGLVLNDSNKLTLAEWRHLYNSLFTKTSFAVCTQLAYI